MIGFFPDLYPDELLYSACARYGERVNYPNKQMVIRDLFGKRSFSAIVDFPTRLNFFLSSIPNHKYSAEEIINQNTLFPFYEPFIATDRAKIIRKEMKSLTENYLQARLAANNNQVKAPEFLRFCPLCVQNGRKEFGETYWHRIHQLAGILVCPDHECFLQNSSVRRARQSSSFFHSAEEFINPELPCFINDKKPAHRIFLNLARNAQWLLNQKDLCLESGELRERYYNILLQRGYAYYNGKVRSEKLFKAFTDFFKPDVLDDLGCSLKSSYKGWLSKLSDKTHIGTFYHPIRHLLLLNFLEINLEEFFTSFIEFKPFDSPPYPCLNKVSSHYKELRIKNCLILDNLTKEEKYRGPVAIFSCDCGFIYQRKGPDKSFEDKFRYHKVKEYGTVWEQELRKHWSNLDLSIAEIARRFNTSSCLITRHAIRLKLPVNTKGTRTLQGYVRYYNPRKYLLENLEDYRKQWLKELKKYPKDNRKVLMNKVNFLYLWLKRHDREWLELHLPQPLKVCRKKVHLNWKKIDKELCKKIKKACSEILQSENLIRVSITEIIRRVGHKVWIEKRDKKLPLAAELIKNSLESLEGFMIRKLKSAERKFIERKHLPTRVQLIRGAVINNTTTKNSLKIQSEIDKSLLRIRKSLLS